MAQVSPDVTIARWRKYGNDRLYVTLADGTKIGYWDLVTDEPHPEKPELARLLDSAYDVWTTGRFPVADVADVADVAGYR